MILILLLYASYTDIRTMEVPLFVTPLGTTFLTVKYFYLLFQGEMALWDIAVKVIAAGILFLIMLVGMKIGNMGGADALLSIMVGYEAGLSGLYILIFAYILCIPSAIHMSVTKKPYPFVPYLTAGYILFYALSFYF